MDQDFTFSSLRQGDQLVIILSGDLSERTNLDGVFENITGGKLIINLKGIRRINSVGVRDWILCMNPLKNTCEIEFVECSRAVVAQLTSITNFLTAGRIVSFYAPYYCDGCHKEIEVLLSPDEHFPTPGDREEPAAPGIACPGCGAPLKFNHDEDQYFSFLTDT
jgi:eukaryotic-like serine/threonine-protein kinase